MRPPPLVGVLIALVLGLGVGLIIPIRVWTPLPREEPLRGVPRDPDSIVVLLHIYEQRPDARQLLFIFWYPPRQVDDDPITHGKATLVHVVFINEIDREKPQEEWMYWVRDRKVLGSRRIYDSRPLFGPQ